MLLSLREQTRETHNTHICIILINKLNMRMASWRIDSKSFYSIWTRFVKFYEQASTIKNKSVIYHGSCGLFLFSFMSIILTTIETGIYWRTVRSELIISLDHLRVQHMHQLLIPMDFPDSFLSLSNTAACHYPEHYRYGLMC